MSKDNERWLELAEELMDSSIIEERVSRTENGVVNGVGLKVKLPWGHELEEVRRAAAGGLDCELARDLCFRAIQKRIAELEAYHDLKSKNERECAMDTTIGDFGWAIRRVKKGDRVRRRGWNGKGMYVFLAECNEMHTDADISEFEDEDIGCEVQDMLVLRTAQRNLQPGWLASQSDMLADDWEVVAGGKEFSTWMDEE